MLSWSLKIDELSQGDIRACNNGEVVDKYVPVLSREVVVCTSPFISQEPQLKWKDTAVDDRVNYLCNDDSRIPHLELMVLPSQSPRVSQESAQRQTGFFVH